MKPSTFLLVTLLLLFTQCRQSNTGQPPAADTVTTTTADTAYNPHPYVQLQHPAWSKNATIYEVNIRQYTPEGTFKAFEPHLQRLKDMGVDIIWIMPIHPIGQEKRKGTLGSEYSVKDYYAVNPEFGTMADFKALVQKIHSMGMHVILDWVANHSAWDNPLAQQHPDWYTKTKEGNFQPTPWYDWDDVIDFDYNVPAMRAYMTQALEYWVKETDIDGYRCDVAGFIPVDFWEHVRSRLDAIKPVFMLAEWDARDMHRKAFDMTYSWTLWDKMKDAATGNKGINGLVEYMAHDVNTFPHDAYRMTFTENHDKNAWEGTQFSNFGTALPACMVMACTVNGMPLVYSGQEAGLDHSLQFFDKDPIPWKPHPFYTMYQKLFTLKHNNPALWNGASGGEMVRIFNSRQSQVISFFREKDNHRVITIINFSKQATGVTLNSRYCQGNYTELFSGKPFTFSGNDSLQLQPWQYLVLHQ